MLFIGDDWAEAHHDMEIVDDDGRRLARRRLPAGVDGLATLHALVADHLAEDAEADQVVVGLTGTSSSPSPVARRRPRRRPAPGPAQCVGKGAGDELVEGPTKTQARVVDIDSDTVAALHAYRTTRGSLSLELMRNAALVLGTLDGTHRHPERYSRRFVAQVLQGAGEDQLPKIRLHDPRHTHAMVLLAAGEPVKVVSELGHANAMIR